MIESQAGFTQAREQLTKFEGVVAELQRDSDTLHPSQLALLLEGPMDVIKHLHAEIDEFLGKGSIQ
jgi:hypothetical protein